MPYQGSRRAPRPAERPADYPGAQPEDYPDGGSAAGRPARSRHGRPADEPPACGDGPLPGYGDDPLSSYGAPGYRAAEPRRPRDDRGYPGRRVRYPGQDPYQDGGYPDEGHRDGGYPDGRYQRNDPSPPSGRPARRAGGRQDDRYGEEDRYRVRPGQPPDRDYPGPADRDYPGRNYADPDFPDRDDDGRRGGAPPWADDEYEDDRFVPGLGGPRGRAGRDGYDDDLPYEDGEDGADGGGRRRKGRGRSARRDGKRRRSRWVAPLVAVLVILIPIAVGGTIALRFVLGKYYPADYSTDGTGTAVVEVQSGQTATAVGQRLVTLGVVASTRAFELAAEHNPNSRGLEPGFYRLHKHMKASLAYTLMLNPASRVQIKITIPEGWRLSQILAELAAHSGIPAADYRAALASPADLGLPSYAGNKPEGYLFPATYEVQPNMTATVVLKDMVHQFDAEAANINLNSAAAKANMTPAQVITVASLLQAEGGKLSDYPKIARVIYNRLNRNMPLQFDSTVLYGLGKFGTTVTEKQIQTPTPYNTYLHKGLPPGPIDSPGNAAIEAALHPAPGNWLYFVANKNGVTKFSDTLAGLGG